MDYSSGAQYGYDQIHPNMFGDGYDSAYTQNTPNCMPTLPSRPFLKMPEPPTPPIVTYAAPMRDQRVSLDSRRLECGCVHDSEGMASLDSDSMMYLFIFVLIIIIAINSMNLRHLAKQVKLLSKKNIEMASVLKSV
jgi:hypothetical protein